jgi:hypothetical protein
MLWKLITLAGAAFALWSFARRAFGGALGPTGARPRDASAEIV